MRQSEFEKAAARARSRSKYFPTSAHILEAWEELKELERQERSAREGLEGLEGRGGQPGQEETVPTDRAREVLEALKTGKRPAFLN